MVLIKRYRDGKLIKTKTIPQMEINEENTKTPSPAPKKQEIVRKSPEKKRFSTTTSPQRKKGGCGCGRKGK